MKNQSLLKGKPKRLAVLDYGLFQVHANGRIIGICGFVVETDMNEHVLIDTGFPEKYAVDSAAATAEDDLGQFGQVLSVMPQNMPKAQLDLLGLNVGDIDVMIQSHTHIDHVGHMDGFPGIPIVISAAERSLDRPIYWSGKQPMTWPDATWHLVDGDFDLGPGFRVLLCPGHAPGQLAFLLQLPETGHILLTSDAISRPAEIDEKFEGSWDVEQAVFHGDRLMTLAAEHKAQVIFGHCPDQWQTLAKAPEWFT